VLSSHYAYLWEDDCTLWEEGDYQSNLYIHHYTGLNTYNIIPRPLSLVAVTLPARSFVLRTIKFITYSGLR
jgi:hypothetical protein